MRGFIPGKQVGRAVVSVLPLLWAWGCGASAPTPSPSPAPVEDISAYPSIQDGPTSPAEVREFQRLRSEVLEGVEAGRWEVVRNAALRITGELSATPGSSEALLPLVRAFMETSRWEDADSAAALLTQRLSQAGIRPTDRSVRQPTALQATALQAIALQATARIRSGSPAEGGALLAQIDPEAVPAELVNRIASWMAEWAAEADVSEVRAIQSWLPPGSPFLASISAEAPRAEGMSGALPISVLRGLRLGFVLPWSGSPSQRQFAQLLEEGVAVALAPHQGTSALPVPERGDDGGEMQGAQVAVQRMSDSGVVAIIGPLLDPQVDAAVAARTTPLLMISPTARSVPPEAAHVYSLSGVDPTGPELLARHAAEMGYGRVVVIHPASPEGNEDARRFQEVFREQRGGEVRALVYTPGSTDFQALMEEARLFRARALVAAIPAGDVATLAPQVAYAGLDTLGVQVLGTAAWGTEAVLEAVDPRHTDGVVIATPRGLPAVDRAMETFQQRFETLHRRTLRNPVPALGHDAALLILEAARLGGSTRSGLLDGMSRVRDVPGATGLLSVRDGRVVREHRLVRPRARELHPLDPEALRRELELRWNPPPPPPDTLRH
ncbi:MAG: penicillin-binding protein activator [Gemmatimonadota bacterium]